MNAIIRRNSDAVFERDSALAVFIDAFSSRNLIGEVTSDVQR